MSLLKYTVKRLLAIVPILLGTLAITFVLVRYMPGSPFDPAEGGKYDAEWVADMEAKYGLDKPILEQFWIYLKQILQGEWGDSAQYPGIGVWSLIWQKVPLTLEMQSAATVLSSILGIRAGVFSAVNQNNTKDTVLRFFAFVAYSVPVFWIAQILQVQLCYQLNWFPATGYMTMEQSVIYDKWPATKFKTGFRMVDTLVNLEFPMFINIIHHMFLPIFCMTLGSFAGLQRYVRSSMLEVLELDYVRSARAKGCKERDVINKHALRNSMIPTVTLIGLSFGFMITGSMLTEQVFALNGMGKFYLKVINDRDYFVIQAIVLLITGTVILANLITDLLYGILDPRIRL